jgi:predicted nucleotidyltransferase
LRRGAPDPRGRPGDDRGLAGHGHRRILEPRDLRGSYDEPMPALAQAALDGQERTLLDRLVEVLRDVYGDDLYGVWLYGSRARGERTHDESDIDLLVITRSERSDERLIPLTWGVLDELGFSGVPVDVRQRSLAWVEDRRQIDSFFLRDLDRDKIVLYGGS